MKLWVFFLLLYLFLPVASRSQIPIAEKVDLIGDVRLVGTWQYGTDRLGDELDILSGVLRIRTGIRYTLRDDLHLNLRYGMRMGDQTRRMHFGLHTTGKEHFGLRVGEGALDIFSVRYRVNPALEIELGRFTTSNIIWTIPGAKGEKAEGLAFMTTINIMNIRPGHSIGALVARLPMTCVTTPFVENNQTQYEIRHAWTFSSRTDFHTIMRYQKHIEKNRGRNTPAKQDFSGIKAYPLFQIKIYRDFRIPKG